MNWTSNILECHMTKNSDLTYETMRNIKHVITLKRRIARVSISSSETSQSDETEDEDGVLQNYRQIGRNRSVLSLYSYIECDGKFQTRLFNKIGTKGRGYGKLDNVTGISHVYLDTFIITDNVNHCASVYTNTGQIKSTVNVETGSEPRCAVVLCSGWLAVTLSRKHCVSILSHKKANLRKQIGIGVLASPYGIAIDRNRRIIVSDIELNNVFIFQENGQFCFSLSGNHNPDIKFNQPRHLTVSNSGNIVVADSANHCVKLFTPEGKFIRDFGSFGKEDGQLKFPYGVCTDNDENIIVADYFNSRISMFSKEGIFIQHIISASTGLYRPQAVATRKTVTETMLYVTHGDMKAHQILVYKVRDTDKVIKTDIEFSV